MKRTLLAAFALVALAPLAAAPLRAQGWVVIVNSANPVSDLSKDDVSKLMLKKTPKWKTGQEVFPIEFGNDAIKETFSKAVHGRPSAAIKSYWQQQLFAGKDVPPPEMALEKDVIGFVRANPNAIGYVSAGADLGTGVKVVAVH
jgi:ABC-type phosphate transport system substrate-binding protein